MHKYIFKFIVPCYFFLSCSTTSDTKSDAKYDQAIQQPKLIVFVTVDQLRFDYFDRFSHLFKGGLKRLWTEGSVFTNAHHNHTPTNTAPGHATLSTGSFPARHGVVSNGFYHKPERYSSYCVEDLSTRILGVDDDGSLPGRSPKNLSVDALGDWLKLQNRKSKVISVSKKDRSAILMGGKNPDYALWFDELAARFVTSDYYKKKYPKWADKFQAKEVMAEFLENGWHKKMGDEVYSLSREDDFPEEMGAFLPTFPHTKDRMAPGFPEGRKNAVMLYCTPMADEMIINFAYTALKEEKLGIDGDTDILFLGCSAADAIGHHFGPYSQEIQDYYLWLDEYLGTFFDKLDREIGPDNYWVALSSDHGVAPMPEEMARRGVDARRLLYNEVVPEMNAIIQGVKNEFRLFDTLLLNRSGGLILKYEEALSKGITPKDINEKLCRAIEELEYVENAFHFDQLESDENIPNIELFRHSHYKGRSPDIVINFKEYYLVHGQTGTNHGSIYSYDTHVPIIFLGRPFSSRKIDRRVQTADIAPTLAHLLKLNIPREVDGKVLAELLE